MKILVCGAGVMGSLYAAKLSQSGNDVSILAQGKRYNELYGRAIFFRLLPSREIHAVDAMVVSSLTPGDEYDLAIVLTQPQEMQAALSQLQAAKRVKQVLLMAGEPASYKEWEDAIGNTRLVLGIPGVIGYHRNGIVNCKILPELVQPTLLGFTRDAQKSRLTPLVRVFRKAGFPTTISNNLLVWHKQRQAFADAVRDAVNMTGGNAKLFIEKPDITRMLVDATRDNLRAVEAENKGIPTTRLKILFFMPKGLLCMYWERLAKTRFFENTVIRQITAAKEEQKQRQAEQKVALDTSIINTSTKVTPIKSRLKERAI